MIDAQNLKQSHVRSGELDAVCCCGRCTLAFSLKMKPQSLAVITEVSFFSYK